MLGKCYKSSITNLITPVDGPVVVWLINTIKLCLLVNNYSWAPKETVSE